MNGKNTTMNYKPSNMNNFIDLSLFKTCEDAEKFILETKIEVEDINNQIKDFVELLEVSNKINTELDVDADWIVKAQYARRIKLNHIYTVEQWLTSKFKQSSDTNLSIRVSMLEQQTDNLQKKLEKEKKARVNAHKSHHHQIGFTYRAIRELFLLVTKLFKDNQIPFLPTQDQLTWVDETINQNPNALLIREPNV